MNSLFGSKKGGGDSSLLTSLSEIQANVHLKIQLLSDEMSQVHEVLEHLKV